MKWYKGRVDFYKFAKDGMIFRWDWDRNFMYLISDIRRVDDPWPRFLCRVETLGAGLVTNNYDIQSLYRGFAYARPKKPPKLEDML